MKHIHKYLNVYWRKKFNSGSTPFVIFTVFIYLNRSKNSLYKNFILSTNFFIYDLSMTFTFVSDGFDYILVICV